MREETESTRPRAILEVLSRWLKPPEDGPSKDTPGDAGAAATVVEDSRGRPSPASPPVPEPPRISSRAMSITERLAVLKRTLEFEGEVLARLQSIRSDRQLQREAGLRDQMHRADRDEKKCLQSQARERTLLIQENRRLRSEIESSKRWLELLRKSEQQCRLLKKERSEMASGCERAQVEVQGVSQKLAKVTAEYNLLIGEYQKIFEGQ